MRRHAALLIVAALLVQGLTGLRAQVPSFRANVNLVVVDVVVRDRSGAIVHGLTANDFEIREDNRAQQIRSFDFQEVATAPTAPLPAFPRTAATPTSSSCW